jgi:putative membrane protein
VERLAKVAVMRSLLLRWVILAGSIAVVAAVWDAVEVDGGVMGYLWVAALFGIVNVLIRPIVSLLTLPLTILTFGLFSIVVNGLMLLITAAFTDLLDVDGFLVAVVAAFFISVLSSFLNKLVLSD